MALKHIAQNLKPSNLTLQQANRRNVVRFANKMGLVYFGRVRVSESSEHELLRGLTASPKQQDRHYIVGSLYDYDIAFVERTSVLHYPGKPSRQHVWQIMQFDLHTSLDMPHIYIGLRTQSEVFYATLFAKFSQLQEAAVNVFGDQQEAFFQRYSIFTSAMHYQFTEYLISTEVRAMIASHFGSFAIEIHDGSLYIYTEQRRITRPLLETMLQNGIWLARHLDERMSTLHAHQN